MKNPTPKIQFWFERQRHVIPCEFSGLLEIFKPQSMTPLGVQQYCDSVQILFSGYGDETRLPFTIPEVRRFLQRLRQEWLFAPYFCDLTNCFVSLEAMAHVQNFAVLTMDNSEEIYFQINTQELKRYVRESHHVIRRLGRFAEMSTAEIRAREKRFDEYIGLRLGSGV